MWLPLMSISVNRFCLIKIWNFHFISFSGTLQIYSRRDVGIRWNNSHLQQLWGDKPTLILLFKQLYWDNALSDLRNCEQCTRSQLTRELSLVITDISMYYALFFFVCMTGWHICTANYAMYKRWCVAPLIYWKKM